jgi:flagellar biosynthesis/type III secretory pathway chaperone
MEVVANEQDRLDTLLEGYAAGYDLQEDTVSKEALIDFLDVLQETRIPYSAFQAFMENLPESTVTQMLSEVVDNEKVIIRQTKFKGVEPFVERKSKFYQKITEYLVTIAKTVKLVDLKRLLVFFLVAFGFTWFFWMPDALSKMGLISTSPLTELGFLGAFGPLVSAIIVTAAYEGRRDLVALFVPSPPRDLLKRIDSRTGALMAGLLLLTDAYGAGLFHGGASNRRVRVVLPQIDRAPLLRSFLVHGPLGFGQLVIGILVHEQDGTIGDVIPDGEVLGDFMRLKIGIVRGWSCLRRPRCRVEWPCKSHPKEAVFSFSRRVIYPSLHLLYHLLCNLPRKHHKGKGMR